MRTLITCVVLGALLGGEAFAQARANQPNPAEPQYRDALMIRAWELALAALYRRGCAEGRDAQATDRIEAQIRTRAQRLLTSDERRGALLGAQIGIERELLERFRSTQGEGRVNFTALCEYLEAPMLGMALRHIQEP